MMNKRQIQGVKKWERRRYLENVKKILQIAMYKPLQGGYNTAR